MNNYMYVADEYPPSTITAQEQNEAFALDVPKRLKVVGINDDGTLIAEWEVCDLEAVNER